MNPALQKENRIDLREVLLFAENSTDGIYLYSGRKFTFVNSALGLIFHCPPETFYENPDFLKDCLHPEDRKIFEGLTTAGNNFPDRMFSMEARIQIPEGLPRWIWIRQFPVLDAYGNFLHVAGLVSDITATKESVFIKDSEIGRLKELNEAKDKYFSIISHDLRSPVNAILSFTGYILRNYESFQPFELKQVLNDLHLMTQSGVSLLDNLLHWSRSQMENQDPALKLIPLEQVVNMAVSGMEAQALGKNINMQQHVPPGIVLHTDENMLAMVFRNILSNAVKYSHRGGLIEIKVLQDECDVVFAVSDNGIGMEADQLGRLFSLGNNHSTPGTEKEQGAGLGLILCKEFIERLGGRIWVQSWPGLGTRFSFSIPTADSALY